MLEGIAGGLRGTAFGDPEKTQASRTDPETSIETVPAVSTSAPFWMVKASVVALPVKVSA